METQNVRAGVPRPAADVKEPQQFLSAAGNGGGAEGGSPAAAVGHAGPAEGFGGTIHKVCAVSAVEVEVHKSRQQPAALQIHNLPLRPFPTEGRIQNAVPFRQEPHPLGHTAGQDDAAVLKNPSHGRAYLL